MRLELAAIAFVDVIAFYDDMGRLRPFSSLDRQARKAIKDISQNDYGLTIKTHDKVKALDKLALHLGLFDQQENDQMPHAIDINIIPSPVEKPPYCALVQTDYSRDVGVERAQPL